MKRVGVTASKEKYAQTYVDALRRFGVEPMVITPESPDGILELFDGLVLTGGSDINPKLYGEEPAPETEKPNDERDAFEMKVLKEALARNMPVLAICRGIQMLNVLKKGTLIQHLPTVTTHRQNTLLGDDKSAYAHAVDIMPRTKLAKIIGTDTVVNSRHHQAIGKLGKGLKVTAVAGDGTVEAVQVRGKKFAIGVQWHPENQVGKSDAADKLFQAFVDQL